MAINKEGAEHSTFVIDTNKIVCPYCNGTQMFLSNLMDDPNDITEDTVFADLLITAAGSPIMGTVALCKQCGHTHVPLWYLFDVGASDGTKIVMTNLDQATTADLLTGKYLIYLGTDANNKFEYFIVNTNTAAAPTHITPTVAPHADSDGVYMITNILPFGLTAAT